MGDVPPTFLFSGKCWPEGAARVWKKSRPGRAGEPGGCLTGRGGAAG